MTRRPTDPLVGRIEYAPVLQPARRPAASLSGDDHRANSVRRYLIAFTGKDGYLHVVHSVQNLVQWLLRVAVLELGASATFWVPKLLLRGPSDLSGPSPVTLHHWTAYIGLFGFLISELLYELQSILHRVVDIQASWRKGQSLGTRRRY